MGGLALTAATFTAASVGHAVTGDLGWRGLDDAASGTHVDYPANVFSVAERSQLPGRPGKLLATPDGRAHLAVFAARTPAHSSPAAFIARHLKVPASSLHYERTTPRFFAISGFHGNDIYYARCNASSDQSLLHCINLVYPALEKRQWDSIVTRISLTLHAAR
jgi:hypothetical protein